MLKLIIDSREQKLLEFKEGIFDVIEIDGMPVGDYWASISDDNNNWYELPIVFERKGLGDLFGTMTNGYSRFKNEMQKANDFGLKMILLIEGSMRQVAKGYEHSKFSGDSMLKKLAMLYVKYDLQYVFCNDRREMARYIEEVFSAISRNYKQEKS